MTPIETILATGGMTGQAPQSLPLRYEPRNPHTDLLVRAALHDLARLFAATRLGRLLWRGRRLTRSVATISRLPP